jgi:hypothetical protein
MRIRSRLLTVQVNDLPIARSVSKTEATSLYQVIKDEDLSES